VLDAVKARPGSISASGKGVVPADLDSLSARQRNMSAVGTEEKPPAGSNQRNGATRR